MGFKPASTVKLEHFVKPCAFIYPDESECKGSSAFFMALLKRCIAKQVVAICSYYPRTTSTVRFVALVAQDEVKAPDNTQETPPGFIVVFLPFAGELISQNKVIAFATEKKLTEIFCFQRRLET